MERVAKRTRALTPSDYDQIDAVVKPTGDEFYAVVTSQHRGRFIRSVHVFRRQPTTKELLAFEALSSKIRVRGNRTDFEGSPLEAHVRLYNTLIDRAYDVPVGRTIIGEAQPDGSGYLTRSEACEKVPDHIKRASLRDALGNHFSESQTIEMEEQDEDENAKNDKGENVLAPLADAPALKELAAPAKS